MLHGYRLRGEAAADAASDPRGLAGHLRGEPAPLLEPAAGPRAARPGV
jgi:hypothetical protein